MRERGQGTHKVVLMEQARSQGRCVTLATLCFLSAHAAMLCSQ
jgi:hypothetical protein